MKEVKNTIKLLRFPFSIFLLPISLFSFYYIHPKFSFQLCLLIGIWHLLVFPSSNGYNSYHDQDEGPIGSLAFPPKPTKLLLHLSNVLDFSAILLSFFVNSIFAFFVFSYILVSRLYSNRKIRLKQYPISGFFVVFIFQGVWVFCANVFALSSYTLLKDPSVFYAAIATSFFIATIYPLTQNYQHEADRKDGVRTISMLLGHKSTFIFSGLMFLLASFFIFCAFSQPGSLQKFWLYNLLLLPAAIYFLRWAMQSFQNRKHINYRNTMTMLVLSSLLNNIYFIVLLIKF